MELPNEALTQDGYINYQSKMTNFIYDNTTVAAAGCGPISAYNALKALNKNPDFGDVLSYFNKTAIRIIDVGSNVFQFWGIARRYGAKIKIHIKKSNFGKINVGVLWYKHSGGWHYAMYRRISNNKYCFYSVIVGHPPIISTVEDFLKERTVSRICSVFEFKERDLDA